MYARVSTYKAQDAERILEGFRSVTDPLERMEGFQQAYFLVDRDSGKAMSITLWDSEQAVSESTRQADELRKRGTETGGGTIESVETYEVGLTARAPAAH